MALAERQRPRVQVGGHLRPVRVGQRAEELDLHATAGAPPVRRRSTCTGSASSCRSAARPRRSTPTPGAASAAAGSGRGRRPGRECPAPGRRPAGRCLPPAAARDPSPDSTPDSRDGCVSGWGVSASVRVRGAVNYAQTTHTGGEHGIGEAMSGVLSAAVAPPGPAGGVTHSCSGLRAGCTSRHPWRPQFPFRTGVRVVPATRPAVRLNHRNVTLPWSGQRRCHIAVAALDGARQPGRDP